jgi:hypothetical protein
MHHIARGVPSFLHSGRSQARNPSDLRIEAKSPITNTSGALAQKDRG